MVDASKESGEEAQTGFGPPRHPQDLESPQDKKIRYRSIRIGQVALFIFAIGFSICLTGVYPYMKQLSPGLDEEALLFRYGWVISANPLGQMIASPFFGWLYQKTGSATMVGLITSVAYIAGNVLYSILSVFPENYRFWLLLSSRFIVGASSGNIATVRSYIAGATFTSERTSAMSIVSSFQSLGFTIGPGIQAALTPLQCTDINGQTSEQYLSIDLYTSAGWVSALLGCVSLILFLPCIFQEVDVSAKERQYARDCRRAKGDDKADHAADPIDTLKDLPKPDIIAATVCVISFFICGFNFVLVETLGTPMCMDQFAWTEEETVLKFGVLIACTGVMCVILYASVGPLSKRFDERKILIFGGILFMFLGRILILPIPGFDHPPLASQNDSSSEELLLMSTQGLPSQYELFLRDLPRATKNIPCIEVGKTPGCDLEWCKTTPAVTILQFFGGIVVGTIGYPYAVGISQSLFSKIIGPRPQGLWMGMLSAFGSLSRVLGPIFVSTVYRVYGTYFAIGSMAVSMVISLVLIVSVYKRLVPLVMEEGGGSRQEQESTRL